MGEFISGSFCSNSVFELYPFIRIKKFIHEKTTNRILNNRWFVFQLKNQYFLGKEISSLPPLLDLIDRGNSHFFDLDFPEGEGSVSKIGVWRRKSSKADVDVMYFSDEALQETTDYDNIDITTIFFKNGIDFLRSTVLKEQNS